MNTFEAKVCGIPCQIQVDVCNIVKGNPSTWDSDMDFYGYEEIEFTILDSRGRKADWLFAKAEKTNGEIERIEGEIIQHYKSGYEP